MGKLLHTPSVLDKTERRGSTVDVLSPAPSKQHTNGNFLIDIESANSLPSLSDFQQRPDVSDEIPEKKRFAARRHFHRFNRRGAAFLIFAVLLGFYGLQLWLHATQISATYDEPVHILAGYRAWQCGDYGINPEHPPLLKLLATLPLRAQQLVGPSWPCGSKLTGKTVNSQAGMQFLTSNGVSRILLPTRLSASFMSLALALLVFLAAGEMFGWIEGLVATAILVFEPNLIAHGSLVTTDMAFTTTMFASVYTLYRYRQRPGALRLLLSGLAVGLMLASKHSAILMLPVLLLVFNTDIFLSHLKGKAKKGRALSRTLLHNLAALTSIFLLALLVLWATYGFRHAALPGEGKETVSIVDFLRSSPSPEMVSYTSGILIQLIDHAHIFPAAYTLGLADVLASGSRPTSMLGRYYSTGQWFYFPLAFTIKSSLALIILLPLGLLTRGLYRRRSREILFLLLPSLAFFAISLTWHINIGVRHILVVYPLFIVIAAAGACVWARRYRSVTFALAALLLLHAATAWQTAPNYIAFANAFWGGTNNVHRLLDDSNVEWGQNLNLVDEYLAREGTGDCWITDSRLGEPLRLHRPCHIMSSFGAETADGQFAETVPRVIEGTVLVSTEVLPPLGGGEYKQFANMKPVTILGGSILVYRGRFEVPEIAAVSCAARATQQNRLKLFIEAIESSRKAVELAPDDPRGHAVLGFALAHVGQSSEARQELKSALRLTGANPIFFKPLEKAVATALQFLP